MNTKKIFSEIINKLTSKYSIKSKLIPTYRFIENDKYLYIILRLIKNTEYNPYNDKDIYFSITLDDKFPESFPLVKCITNFSFPSLYDNSDLYKSIIHFKEINIKMKKEEPFMILEQIILGLTPFLEKVKINQEKKVLIYYGEYLLDEIYDINDFLGSKTNEFFRVNLISKGNKFQKYIILTDIYFLLFDPVPDVFNFAKLIFYTDIRSFEKIKELENEKIITYEYKNKNKNKVIKLCFELEEKYEDFLIGKNTRIDKLKYNIIAEKNGEDNINNDSNIKKFQLSKSFEYEL